MHANPSPRGGSHLPAISLIVACTLCAMFAIGFSLRLFVPVFSEREEVHAQKKARAEILDILRHLAEYTSNSDDGLFPMSLTSLSNKSSFGSDKIEQYLTRYWYLPQIANQSKDYVTPIVIEKTNHYSGIRGGYVAFSAYDYRWLEEDEYMSYIRRYIDGVGDK